MTTDQAKALTADYLAEFKFGLTLEALAAKMALADGASHDEAEDAMHRIDIAAFERNVIEYVADALSLKVANARYQIWKEQQESKRK